MLCYTMLGSIKRDSIWKQFNLKVGQKQGAGQLVFEVLYGKVEVVSIYRDIRRFVYRFDGIFFALPPRALKKKRFDLSFTVHFNRNGGGQFHDFFAFSLLALYKCKQNVNLPKRNFMYELI